jgi:tol-pal system protein YbgF
MKRSLLIIASSSIFLLACVSGSDFKRLELQVSDLQDEISVLKRQSSSKEEVQQLNEALRRESERLLKSSADLSVKMNQLDERLQNVQGSLEQTNYRIDRVVQQTTQSEREVAELRNLVRASSSNPGAMPLTEEITVRSPSPSARATEDPMAIYQAALRDYQRGNFELALEGFTDFLAQSPQSDLADNAAYWIGESLYSQKKFRPAIEQFNRVINDFPRSDKIPAALLKKGYAYIELGERAQGVVQLRYVVNEHPRSPEAALAREKMRSLGIETR